MTIWIHSFTPGSSQAVLTVLTAKQKETYPDNELSVTENVADTEQIIKVGGADKQYNTPIPPAQIIRIYDESDHAEIFTFFYTPSWQIEEP